MIRSKIQHAKNAIIAIAGKLSVRKTYIILFTAFLFVPAGFLIPSIISKENNIPAKNIHKYIKDNFITKKTFLKLNAAFKIKVFHISPSKQVILGKDGWLFYEPADESEKSLIDYRGLSPFTEHDLDLIHSYFAKKASFLKSRNIPFIVMIPPNKEWIYDNYLPDSIIRVSKINRLDQILERCKDIGNISFIDLRDDFRRNREKNNLYIKSDTHWNCYGALRGYGALISKIREYHPATTLYTLEDFIITNKSFGETKLIKIGDLTMTMSAPENFFENRLDVFTLKNNKTILSEKNTDIFHYNKYQKRSNFLVKRSTGSSRNPSAVIFHDSFILYMDYLYHSFSRSSAIWSYKIDEDIIGMEKPDFVILEIQQRFLQHIAEIEEGTR